MSLEKAIVLKVVLIGNSGCGKTSLMQQYVNRKFSLYYKATIGADFLSKEIFVDGRNVLLQIWDTAGQETFRSLGSAFYRGADGCVLVFDVTNKYTFECLSGWKDNFLRTTSHVREDQHGRVASFVIMGNKADLVREPHSDEARVVRSDVTAWMEDNQHDLGNTSYFETSASTGENVEQAFMALVRETLARYDDCDRLEPESRVPVTETIDIMRKPPKQEGCGC